MIIAVTVISGPSHIAVRGRAGPLTPRHYTRSCDINSRMGEERTHIV